MKKCLIYIYLLLLTSLCCLQAGAVSSEIRSLSVSDGLPDLVINTIYKDSKGYVWMGTNTSVERFDGIRLEHYMVEGSNENLKRVFALVEMPDNELWVGTGMGLFRLADDAYYSFSCFQSSLFGDRILFSEFFILFLTFILN